jgi:hypothetical protein
MEYTPDTSKASSGQLLEGLEVELEGYESQLRELNNYSEKPTIEYNQKVELQEVLEKAAPASCPMLLALLSLNSPLHPDCPPMRPTFWNPRPDPWTLTCVSPPSPVLLLPKRRTVSSV